VESAECARNPGHECCWSARDVERPKYVERAGRRSGIYWSLGPGELVRASGWHGEFLWNVDRARSRTITWCPDRRAMVVAAWRGRGK
jgi:hypothetical protein